MSDKDEPLKNWQAEEVDVCDLVCRHFDDANITDTYDIGNEATRIYNLMFCQDEDEVEHDSPIDYFLYAVACAGWNAAIKLAASFIGVEEDGFEFVIHKFRDEGDAPVGPSDGMIKEMARYEEWINSFKSFPPGVIPDYPK